MLRFVSKPIDDPESHTSEPPKPFESIPDSTFLQDMFLDMGIKLKTTASTASTQSQSVVKMLESETGIRFSYGVSAGPEDHASKEKEQNPKFKFEDRDLNREEKNGLWLLGGILGGGFWLGGSGKKNGKVKKEAKAEKV